MNLTELTNYVWSQTDTSEYDLPAATIASYIDEAFQRTIAAENRWPFYEKSWELTVFEGNAWANLDAEVSVPGIMSLTSQRYGYKLQQIDQTEGELRFGSDLETPGDNYVMYSIWERRANFWPRTAASENLKFDLRGYRHPTFTFASSGEVDADERLHKPLAHYAVALAYAQQEDEVLERTYMERWQKDVEMARRAIMDAPKNRPVIMHGNFPRTPVGGWRGAGLWP